MKKILLHIDRYHRNLMFFNEHGDRRYMCFIFIPIYSASIKKISKFIEFCKIAAAQRHSRRLHKEKNSPALRIYIRWTRGTSVLHIIYYHNHRFTQPSLQANSQMTMPAVTDTLSECFVPNCGISMEPSQASTTCCCTPLTSLPSTTA